MTLAYLLGIYCMLYSLNFSVRDPRHNSDHFMVLGCLHSAPLREHARYLGGSKRLPLHPPTAPTREDGLCAALRRANPKPKPRKASKTVWISAATWGLVDERVSARRNTVKYQTHIHRLGRAINARLKEYKHRWTEEEVKEVHGQNLIVFGSTLHDPTMFWRLKQCIFIYNTT